MPILNQMKVIVLQATIKLLLKADLVNLHGVFHNRIGYDIYIEIIHGG
ncbi:MULTISPECIES: hypothetical protein [Kamptonema]|nr:MULTISPECIES: hypothetical protein [Kamptonema]